MNLQDAGVGGLAVAIIAGCWKWLSENTQSKEKIRLRQLDIEAKSKEVVNAVMLEYQQKQNEILKKLNSQSLEIGELKQVVATLATYFKAVVEIAENNIENTQIRAVVKGMHAEADKIISKIKTA